MRYGLLILVITIAMPVHADNWSVGVAFSAHSDDGYDEGGKRYEYDQVHPIIGYHRDNGVEGYLFQNSYGDISLTLGKRWAYRIGERTELDFYFGPVSGYDQSAVVAWSGFSYHMGEQFIVQAKVSTQFAFVGAGVIF